MPIRTAVEASTLKILLGLPERAQRLLAGRPLRLDGQQLAVDTQLLLRLLRLRQLVQRPSSETAPIPQGRTAMRHNTALVRGEQPVAAVRELEVAGLRARHYLPSTTASGPDGDPVLLFFHGGSFIYGDLDTHDGPCRVLAEVSGVPVLAIDYRLAPESPFPAAFEDAEAAHRWVVDHAAKLGVDTARIGVGGDSAGANIAAWVAIAASRGGIPLAWQLLVYPCADPHRDTASYRMFGEGFYLTREGIEEDNDIFLPTEAERADERVDLVHAELPVGLAPAYVATAGFDPLRDEGEAYSRRLADAGVTVELQRFPDQIHGFFNIVGVGRTSRAAVAEIALHLRKALG